jgi:hypothetical protein
MGPTENRPSRACFVRFHRYPPAPTIIVDGRSIAATKRLCPPRSSRHRRLRRLTIVGEENKLRVLRLLGPRSLQQGSRRPPVRVHWNYGRVAASQRVYASMMSSRVSIMKSSVARAAKW